MIHHLPCRSNNDLRIMLAVVWLLHCQPATLWRCSRSRKPSGGGAKPSSARALGIGRCCLLCHACIHRIKHACQRQQHTNSRRCGHAEHFMPCRPKLCQRLAARLSNSPPTTSGNGHIWVTDELLSDAFNRYVRVSHASRRYGSNVPGPLEARRRLAKRRMGCAVVGASMGPPGGDFGALFGAGGGNFLENNWSYKPPNVQLDSPSETRTPSNTWNWGVEPPGSLSGWDQQLETPPTEEDLIEASQSALDDMLEAVEQNAIIGGPQITPLIDFLTSSADEPGARNTARLTEWLAKRPVGSTAIRAVTGLTLGKVKLATIEDDELMDVIRNLSDVTIANDARAEPRLVASNKQLHDAFTSILESLHEQKHNNDALYECLVDALAKTTREPLKFYRLTKFMTKVNGIFGSVQILSRSVYGALEALHKMGGEQNKTAFLQFALSLDAIPPSKMPEVLETCTGFMIPAKGTENPGLRQILLLWLRCLDENEMCTPSSGGLIHVVYTMLGEHFRPSELWEHFKGKRTVEIARILLNSWFVRMDPEFLRNASDDGEDVLTHDGQIMFKVNSRDLIPSDLPDVSQTFERLMFEIWPAPCAYTTLARAFAMAGLRSGGVIAEVFNLCRKLYAPWRVHNYFSIMLNCPGVGVPKVVVVSLIQHLLAEGRSFNAICVFKDSPFVALSDVPELPRALLEDKNFRPSFLLKVLHREPDFTPIAERQVSHLNLTQSHIDAVHTLAYEISKAEALRTTVAYRYVYAYYRFLHDCGAPLDPLISRALVTAGILRPIKDRIWIPEARYLYILDIVERIEGSDVRHKLHKLAFRMREVTHDAVLLKRRRLQEGAWMADGNEMAERARFRKSPWAKGELAPTSDGKSYFVPQDNPFRRKHGRDEYVDQGTRDVMWVRPSFLGKNTAVSGEEGASALATASQGK